MALQPFFWRRAVYHSDNLERVHIGHPAAIYHDRLLAELPLQLACHDSASVYQNFRAVYGGEVLYELFKQHRVFHNAASCLYHFYIIHFQYHMRSIEKEAFL